MTRVDVGGLRCRGAASASWSDTRKSKNDSDDIGGASRAVILATVRQEQRPRSSVPDGVTSQASPSATQNPKG